MIDRRLWIAIGLAAGCTSVPTRELDRDRIVIEGAQMRTDSVGSGKFLDTATFVLVDARNTASEGAYVTLAGELVDAGGAVVGELAMQSLWIPAGETRMFALVDTERKPRSTAKTARAKVRGASVKPAPLAHIEDFHSFDDNGRLVLQAYLVNDANRDSQVMVVGAFYDANERPMTRPFSVVRIKAKQDPTTPGNCPDGDADLLPMASKCPIQLIGPRGATRGTMFVGDTQY